MEVKHALVWFWLELLHAAKSLARGRVWSGGSYIETLRRYIKTLLDHQYPKELDHVVSQIVKDVMERATQQG